MPARILKYHAKDFNKYKIPSNLKQELMDKKIKIGIELEWEFDDPENTGYYDYEGDWIDGDTSDYYRENFIYELNRLGIYPRNSYENLRDNTLDFTIEEDGSLWEDSCEFVTRPINFHPQDLSDIEFIKKVLDVLNKDYDVYSENSGMHVHINQDDFYSNNSTKSKLCQILFCSLMNKREFWQDVYKWSERNSEIHTRNYSSPREMIGKYDIQDKINHLALCKDDDDIACTMQKYWNEVLDECENKYSMTHKTTYNTIEIRVFNSTSSWDKIIDRLNTIYKMIEFCRTLTNEILDKGVSVQLDNITWEHFYNNKYDTRVLKVGVLIYSVTDGEPFYVYDYDKDIDRFKAIRLRDKISYNVDLNFKIDNLEDFGRMFSFDKIKGDIKMKTMTEIVDELGLRYQKNYNDIEDTRKILFLFHSKTSGIYNRIYVTCNTGLGGFVRIDGENNFTGIQEQFISKLKENNISWDEIQLYLIDQYKATLTK